MVSDVNARCMKMWLGIHTSRETWPAQPSTAHPSRLLVGLVSRQNQLLMTRMQVESLSLPDQFPRYIRGGINLGTHS